MRRYRKLIIQKIEDGIPIRVLAREMGIGAGSICDYRDTDQEPKLAMLERMSAYFDEPVSVLIGEDDDLTARLLTLVRRLPDERKHALLAELEVTTAHPARSSSR